MNHILVKLLFVSPLFFVSCMANTCSISINKTPEKCKALLEKEASLIPSSCDCANFNADDTFSSCCAFGEPCTLSGVGTAGCTADMVAITPSPTPTRPLTTYSYSEDQTCSSTFCKHYHNVDGDVCVATAGSAQIIWDIANPYDCGIDVFGGGEVLCTEKCGGRISLGWLGWLIVPVAIAAIYWCCRVRTKRGGNYTAADHGQNKKPDDDVAVATTDVGATTPAAAETQVLEKA